MLYFRFSRVNAALVLIAAAMLPAMASAQSYPSRPVRLISPNPPGGANDVIARIVINRLAEVLQVYKLITLLWLHLQQFIH